MLPPETAPASQRPLSVRAFQDTGVPAGREVEPWLLVLPGHCHLGAAINKAANNPFPPLYGKTMFVFKIF